MARIAPGSVQLCPPRPPRYGRVYAAILIASDPAGLAVFARGARHGMRVNVVGRNSANFPSYCGVAGTLLS